MRSIMTHRFSEVPQVSIPRSTFDRSHGYKTTFDAGYLIPFLVDEALPGDTFNVNVSGFARLATPIFPIMDNMFMDTFFFAVPYRLVWDNWQKFCGEQTDPGDSIDYTLPYATAKTAGFSNLSLFDYMGLPTKMSMGTGFKFQTIPFRAYHLIWNEWFRDENLQDSYVVPTDDGPDAWSDHDKLQRRGKRHDYFTSCLPWLQKGDSVELPLGTTAPVTDNGAYFNLHNGTEAVAFATVGSDNKAYFTTTPAGGSNTLTYEDGLQVDLSTATAATINELRQSFQIQKLIEKDARAGTRYTEIVRSHFGVTSPDARLQRPEYLGGGSTPINITPVPQTSSTDVTSPQGNLSAYGTAGFNGHGFIKSFTEHCVIIGLVSVRADLTYQQGLDRMWSRQTRYDVYWPSLAHIGEQAVLNKEIYLDGSANDELVFGYQERFAEYRYKPSKITGQFRSNATTSLEAWHLCQDFSSLPALNSTFIEENPPIDRVIADNTDPHFLFDSRINMICTRPMPVYAVPGLVDHF